MVSGPVQCEDDNGRLFFMVSSLDLGELQVVVGGGEDNVWFVSRGLFGGHFGLKS